MAYIGKQPVVGNFQVCDAISVVNGQAAYTMQVGSANVEPENANHMLVSLNGVLQKPGSSFTISGATITFASNLATGDVIDFIILLGDVLNIGTPSDGTVATASIAADAITEAKIADDAVESEHLNNNIISGQTALSAEPADTDEFLVSDAGTIKRIDYSHIKGGGALVKLVTTTLSSTASTIDFDSTYVTSTYQDYFMVFNIKVDSDGAIPNIRFSTSGSFASGSSDYGFAHYGDGGSDTNNNNENKIEFSGGPGNSTGENASGHMMITGLTSADFYAKVVFNSSFTTTSAAHGYRVGGGMRNAAQAHDGIRLLPSSGDFKGDTTVTLYGIAR